MLTLAPLVQVPLTLALAPLVQVLLMLVLVLLMQLLPMLSCRAGAGTSASERPANRPRCDIIYLAYRPLWMAAGGQRRPNNPYTM